jgi:hypothetical protein
MKYSANYVPAIEAAAVASGCTVREQTPASFKASCGQVDVYCLQHDRIVTRGCTVPVGYSECRRTWDGIIKAITPE